MLRRVMMVAAWVVLVSAARGEEKYTFGVEVKTGDVFEVSEQKVFSIDSDYVSFKAMMALSGLGEPQMSRSKQTFKVVKAENGRAEQIDAQMPEKEANEGSAKAVIRYERIGDEFKPRLLEGDLTPEVAEKLEEGRPDPLWERALPTKPLAVGESQSVEATDLPGVERLDGGSGKVKFTKPPTIALQKIDTVEETRIAFLNISFEERSEETFEVPGQGQHAASRSYDVTILYDLDKKCINQVEKKEREVLPGTIDDRKTVFRIKSAEILRFRRK